MLEQETLTITTKYLSQNSRFLNGTPSNYIIFKRQPGLGATYGEIEYKGRNSIILEPNTPVLDGKRDAVNQTGEKTHPNILVVYKGVEEDVVVAYLNSEVQPKKILCTPEAYIFKVKPAILKSQLSLYKDFFMLLDECDRIIKDVNFRKKITMPMTDFFKFENKAMISATALEPSDKRFEENGFRILHLEPEVNTRQNLDLIHTNNILYSLEETLERNKDEKTFIFINSPKLAYILIKRLNIEEDSKIYCSTKGVHTLRTLKKDFRKATSKLGNFVKYNFLTSRYFSAVDIVLDETPKLIMITDVLRRTFTMLDPYTDVIQIIGRFRNGVATSTHITNVSDELEWKTPENAIKYINDSYNCYKLIKAIVQANSDTEGGYQTGKEALEGTTIATFMDGDTGGLNSFMLDNYCLDQKTRGLYTDFELLKQRYADTEYFKIRISKKWYDVNDAAMLILEKESHTQESNKIIATILNNYNHHRVIEFLEDPNKTINTQVDTEKTIAREYPEIVEIYNTIGFEEMQKLNFDKPKMLRCSDTAKKDNELKNPEMIREIHALFNPGDKPSRTEVRLELKKVYTKFEVTRKASASQIQLYFNAELRGDANNVKYWNILSIKPTG
jgi:hypothetical protein